MSPTFLIRAIDNQTKRKMIAGGLGATLLAASLVLTLSFLGGVWNPTFSGYTIEGIVTSGFADYIPYEEDFVPNAPTYSISAGLGNVVNLGRFLHLTLAEQQMIESNGFVVSAHQGYDHIHEILSENEDSVLPSFVSSDAVLHAFHVLYDLALREAEVYSFWDSIGTLTNSLLDSSYEQYLNAPEGRWKDAALRNAMFFSVAISLLDSEALIRPEVQEAVNEVLALMEAHDGFSDEWFMEYMEDFSQYIPRGHYTRSELLGQYFKAMMWFGRVMFRLVPSGDLESNERGMDETAQAILLTLALTEDVVGLPNGTSGFYVWDAIYEPTAFFVGSADDLLPSEYLALIRETYGAYVTPTILDDDALLDQFIEAALTLREPMILSSLIVTKDELNQTKGLRFMGQRYIPDSYILGQLVFDHVDDRFMPKGLDVMAALGSDRAWELLDDQKHYGNYVEQMEMLWSVVASITDAEWTKNLYYLWLYSLLPLLNDPGAGYPMFMQSAAWVDKQLMTALSSWAELRHDTILYAKQSYTYLTGGPPEPPIGYVEPVPRVYARLAALCRMMISGLGERSLLSELIGSKLGLLHDFLRSLQAISIKELTGTPLNETEIQVIHFSGDTLELVTSLPENENHISDADTKMAVIADVHTDPNSKTILEVGVGNPMVIYVAVPIGDEIVLTRGGTFSYYEFVQPMSDRLTDEAWQDMLDAGEEPPYPSWFSSFVVDTALGGEFVLALTIKRPDD